MATLKTRTWLCHLYNSAAGYDGRPTPGRPREEAIYISGSPTDQEWFRRFIEGTKLVMGECKFQNEALTSNQVVGLSNMLNISWKSSRNEKHKESLEELMSYVLIGFGAGLCGGEVPLVSLKGLSQFWDETKSDQDPHIMVTLHGRFKGESGFRWHCLTTSDQTRSRIPFRLRIGRLLSRRIIKQGRTGGWLLEGPKRRRVKIADYDPEFLFYMEELLAQSPELFSVGTIIGLYSLRRFMRRGPS